MGALFISEVFMSDKKKFCINCGKEIPASAAFCPICSAYQTDIIPKPAPARKKDTEENNIKEDETNLKKTKKDENTYTRTTYNDNPQVQGLTQVYNKSEQVNKEIEQLKEKAYKDQPTGLYNRQKLDEIKPLVDKKEIVTFINIDINNLKKTNDTYGHTKGDELIKNASDVIKKYCKDDFTFRTGGDEFLIILFDKDAYKANDCLKSILDDLEMRKKDSSYGFVPTIASGIYQKQPGDKFDDIYNKSDRIMYQNKSRQKEKDNTIQKVKYEAKKREKEDQKHRGPNVAEMEYNSKKKTYNKILHGRIGESIVLIILIIIIIIIKINFGI